VSLSGPKRFRVLWGDPFKGLDQVIVEAHDPDEALVHAHELRPELPRPRTAYLATEFDLRSYPPFD
jgi:hypothetical protein